MQTRDAAAVVGECITVLTAEMQKGTVDPVNTNSVLSQLTYIKFELENKVNHVNSAIV